ncbi:MAG: Zn-ribbon domain-containing OB-fold protein [Elusimicrobia bacterium]|nr:Zn-ribbon domain-containing OB-fold protein [Elusimicrobiota bacterium]
MSPPPPETLARESRIQVPYAWSAGATLTRFLKGLRDSGRIEATRCPACAKAYVPPRRTCGICFADCAEWLAVGPQGTLLSFTQAAYDSPAHPRPRPCFGLIRLDGADTALLHLLGDFQPGELEAGRRVEAVFAEARSGSVLDIRHFRPVRP